MKHPQTTCKRCHAYASLVDSMEKQMLYLRAEINEYKKLDMVNHEAIATLASEREANARLTEELEALKTPEIKQRGREVMEALAVLDGSKRQAGGVHGQVIGMEQYSIRASGFALDCLHEAQSIISELLDPFDQKKQ